MRIVQAEQTGPGTYLLVQEFRLFWLLPLRRYWVGFLDRHTGFVYWVNRSPGRDFGKRPNQIINAALTMHLNRMDEQGKLIR